MSTRRRSDRKRFISRQLDQDAPSVNSLTSPTNSRSSLVPLNGHVAADNQVSAFVRVKPSPKNYNKFSLDSVTNISSSGLERHRSIHSERFDGSQTLTNRQKTPEQVRTAIGFRPIRREDSVDSESSASVASNDRLQTTTRPNNNNNNNSTYRRTRQQQQHSSPARGARVGPIHRVSSAGSASSYDNLESIGLTQQVEQSPRTSRRQHTWQPQQQQQQYVTDNNITDNGFMMSSNVASGQVWRRPTFSGHIQVVPPSMVGVFDPSRLSSSRYHVTPDSSLPVPSQTSLSNEPSQVLSPVTASHDVSTSQRHHMVSPAHYNNVSHVTNSAVTSPHHVTSPPLTSPHSYSRPSSQVESRMVVTTVDTLNQSGTSGNRRLDSRCCIVTSELPVQVETVLMVQPVEHDSTISESQQKQQREDEHLVEQPDEQQEQTTQQQTHNNITTSPTTITPSPSTVVSAVVVVADSQQQQQLRQQTPTTDDNKSMSPVNTPNTSSTLTLTQQHAGVIATSQTPTDINVTSSTLHDVMPGELNLTSHGELCDDVGQSADKDVTCVVRNCQPASPVTASSPATVAAAAATTTTTTTAGTLSTATTPAVIQHPQQYTDHRVTSSLHPVTHPIIHSTSPVTSSAGLSHVTSHGQETVLLQESRRGDEKRDKDESYNVTVAAAGAAGGGGGGGTGGEKASRENVTLSGAETNGALDTKFVYTASPVLNRRTYRQTRAMSSMSRLQPTTTPNTLCLLARLSPIQRPANNNNNNNRSQSVDRSRHEPADNRRTIEPAAAAATKMTQRHKAVSPVVDNLISEGVNVLAALDSALAVLTSCVGGTQRPSTRQTAGPATVTAHSTTYRHVQAPHSVTSPVSKQQLQQQQQPVECYSDLQLQQLTTSSVQSTTSTTTTTAASQLCREVAVVEARRRRWQDTHHRVENDSFNRPDSPSTPSLDDSHKPTLYSLPADCVILRHRRRHKRDVTTTVSDHELRQSMSDSSTSSDADTETDIAASVCRVSSTGPAGLTNGHRRRSRFNKTTSRVKRRDVTVTSSVDQHLEATFNDQVDDYLTTWIVNPAATTTTTTAQLDTGTGTAGTRQSETRSLTGSRQATLTAAPGTSSVVVVAAASNKKSSRAK